MATKARRLVPQLLKAINAHDLEGARAALDAGADPNGTGGFNAKPLGTATAIVHDAAARDALTRLLLDRGAAPNDPGPYGHDNRPIFYAAHCGYEAVVRMLLDAGGFPRDAAGAPARNSDGATLLFAAATSGLRWLVERCLAEGCLAGDLDRHGTTALHYAATARDGKDTAATIELLLSAGAPLEHVRPGNWGTAMHFAVGHGDAAAVRALVARGAKLEAVNEPGRRPLHAGALHGREEAVRAALEAGAEVDPRDAAGQTPLHLSALRAGHPVSASPGIVRALLERGADARAVDADGKTPHALALAATTPRNRKAPPPSAAQAEVLATLARALG